MTSMKEKITKKVALIIGILTLVPLLSFIGFLINAFPTSWLDVKINIPLHGIVEFGGIITIYWFASILILGLFYSYHACQNDVLQLGEKIVWVLVLFTCNLLIFPLYWYFHIWRSPCVDES